MATTAAPAALPAAPPGPAPWWLVPYLGGVAFLAYFSMYAFRKPFAAATFEKMTFLGTAAGLKTALVISQVFGYALSKLLGIKVCSEATRGWRALLLVGAVLVAELALVAFAVVPGEWKVLAIFFNGLPLGMVWGLVVAYLEGRRTSEVLLAVLSVSFIVSSGVVKDVGLWLLKRGVSEDWMPAAVGAMFLPLFLLSTWGLSLAPGPTEGDVAARNERPPMEAAGRGAFLARFWPGMLLLLVVYFFLTALRDYRDNYQVDLFAELHARERAAPAATDSEAKAQSGLLTQVELRVALGVMVALACLYLISDNRWALGAGVALMALGLLLTGAATLLRRTGNLDGFWWMLLVGLGLYLAYVPFGSLLFDRLIAATRFAGTAVFAIYVADAVGYAGSVVVQLLKDFVLAKGAAHLDLVDGFCVGLALVGAPLMALAGAYFLSQPASVVGEVARGDAGPQGVQHGQHVDHLLHHGPRDRV